MKKILSALLLAIVMLLSACGGVKYEYKDGVMYGDGKVATGTFEFKAGKYKVKGNFVNGLPDGTLEKYYSDGNVMIKDTFVNGEITEEKINYKNGKLMTDLSSDKVLNLYYDDGQLVMTSNMKTGESSTYHENGNPLIVIGNTESILYDENNEMLFKIRKGESVDIGTILKKLEDGTFEIVKNNKVIAKVDANGEIINYLYSTGETLMKSNSINNATEIFFKNGKTFFKGEGHNFTFYYKDGKPLYEMEGDVWKCYNEEGDEIVSNFELVTDIKKVD